MNMNTSVLKRDEVNMYSNVQTSVTPSSLENIEITPEQTLLQEIQAKLGTTLDANPTVEYNADLMPSATTMAMEYKRQYEVYADNNARTATATDTKVKVAIASYIAVALILILAVTLTSLAVSATFGSLTQLNADLSAVTGQLTIVESELASSQDYQKLLDRATAMGFIVPDSGNSVQYDILETRPPQNITVESNWFDKVCDWASGVFGG